MFLSLSCDSCRRWAFLKVAYNLFDEVSHMTLVCVSSHVPVDLRSSVCCFSLRWPAKWSTHKHRHMSCIQQSILCPSMCDLFAEQPGQPGIYLCMSAFDDVQLLSPVCLILFRYSLDNSISQRGPPLSCTQCCAAPCWKQLIEVIR